MSSMDPTIPDFVPSSRGRQLLLQPSSTGTGMEYSLQPATTSRPISAVGDHSLPLPFHQNHHPGGVDSTLAHETTAAAPRSISAHPVQHDSHSASPFVPSGPSHPPAKPFHEGAPAHPPTQGHARSHSVPAGQQQHSHPHHHPGMSTRGRGGAPLRKSRVLSKPIFIS